MYGPSFVAEFVLLLIVENSEGIIGIKIPYFLADSFMQSA